MFHVSKKHVAQQSHYDNWKALSNANDVHIKHRQEIGFGKDRCLALVSKHTSVRGQSEYKDFSFLKLKLGPQNNGICMPKW